jgi:hypothetical protein
MKLPVDVMERLQKDSAPPPVTEETPRQILAQLTVESEALFGVRAAALKPQLAAIEQLLDGPPDALKEALDDFELLCDALLLAR